MPRLNNSKRAGHLMEAFPRTIKFALHGEEGPFSISFRDGRASLFREDRDDADIVVSGSSEAFAKVLSDNVDVSHPIARGDLVVDRGKVSEMTILNRILWSAGRA